VNVHAKSRLTLEPLRTLRSETKGQAGALPGLDAGHPLQRADYHQTVSTIRNIRGMIVST
jgi:hypothetical protein